MASSSNKLTKYKSAVTIITADAANAWYGGLYGSGEAVGLAADDPRVIGHIHDGQHIDGHAGKIDLVDHVSNQLRNVNLADGAVTARNVRSFTSQSSAIPEFEVIDATTYYFLDLSDIRSELSDIRNSLTSDVDEPFYVYWRPNGVATNNVYTDFATSYAAVVALKGPRVVYWVWDSSLTSGVLSIPPGSYDLDGVIVLIDGPNQASFGTKNNIHTRSLAIVEFEDGVTISNPSGFIGLAAYVNKSTTASPIVYNKDFTSGIAPDVALWEGGYLSTYDFVNSLPLPANYPIIRVSTDYVRLVMKRMVIGSNLSPETILVDSGKTLDLFLADGSILNGDMLQSQSGTSTLIINQTGGAQASFTQTSWHTNPLPPSVFNIYGPKFIGADGVNDGLEGLVPTPSATDNTLFLRGDGTWAAPAAGEVNTGVNVGAGTGQVFRDKTGTTLNFKTLVAGTGMSIANNADTIDITNDGVLGATNLGVGEGLFTSVSGNNIQLKSLVAGTNVSLVSGANTITINSTDTSGAFTLDTTATPNLVRLDVSGSGDYTTNNFVFGSPSLDDTGTAEHASRMLFDKSTAAFRAGAATGTQWDTRGNYSFATGLNNTCSSTASAAIGGGNNTCSSTASVAIGGQNNTCSSAASVAIGGFDNTISGVGDSGFAIASTQCAITNATCSGALASEIATINGTYQNAIAIASTGALITADYGMARGLDPLADSNTKLAHGVGQMQGRGAGSAQGGVYVGKGRSTESDTVNIFDSEGTPFTIPNNTVYALDIDVVLVTQAEEGNAVLYGGGKAYAVIKTNSAGVVTINNAGGVYGYLAGATVSIQSSGNNQWFARVAFPSALVYIEAVAHIKSVEIQANSSDLNSAGAYALLEKV